MPLSGSKTYITAAAIAALQFAKMMGWVDSDTTETLTNLLLGGGLAFLRSSIAKK